MHKKDITVEFIKRISGQQAVLTIPRVYLDMLEGDIKTALFLSQVIYWADKGKRTDGWFYKTDKEWNEELCLSEYECKKARDKLVEIGVLLVDKKKANGVPTMHYKIEWDNLSKWVLEKFNNRDETVTDNTSVSEEFGEGPLKNSETHSQETPKSLTENTNKDYDKEKDNKLFPSNMSKSKQGSLFDVKETSSKIDPIKILGALKGKSRIVKKVQLVLEGQLDHSHLDDLDLCFYFSQKHKEIIGYEIPYQKHQYMEQFRHKYQLSIKDAFELIPSIAETFRKICEDDKRKKSDWYLKIGWFIYDAPSDIARIMDKVKPKVNEKYLEKKPEEKTPDNPYAMSDEVF